MAIQGTGTIADPYLITTMQEFVDIFNTFNASSAFSKNRHCKLMNDIDFNDIDYWNFTTIECYFDELDGNGHSIKNIYLKNQVFLNIRHNISGVTISCSIKNIKFEFILFQDTKAASFITISGRYSTSYNSQVLFNNVEFIGKMYTASSVIPFPVIGIGGRYFGQDIASSYCVSVKIINSNFNIDCFIRNNSNRGLFLGTSIMITTSNPASGIQCVIENCQFKATLLLDNSIDFPLTYYNVDESYNLFYVWTSDATSTYDGSIVISYNVIFTNVYTNPSATNNKGYINILGAAKVATLTNNILIHKSMTTKSIVQYVLSGNKSLFVYNSNTSVPSVHIKDDGIAVTDVTDTQIKDRNYLVSIGLPIL